MHCTFSCGGCVKMCSWQHWVGCRLIVSYFYFNLLINWRGNPAQNFIFYCGLFWAMTIDLCLSMLHATRENHKIINEFVLGWMHWLRSCSGWLVLIYSTCANFHYRTCNWKNKNINQPFLGCALMTKGKQK